MDVDCSCRTRFRTYKVVVVCFAHKKKRTCIQYKRLSGTNKKLLVPTSQDERANPNGSQLPLAHAPTRQNDNAVTEMGSSKMGKAQVFQFSHGMEVVYGDDCRLMSQTCRRRE